jgi:hypothetical protein
MKLKPAIGLPSDRVIHLLFVSIAVLIAVLGGHQLGTGRVVVVDQAVLNELWGLSYLQLL